MFKRYMEVLFVVLALLLLTGCGGKELPVSTQSAAEKEEARLEASVETAGEESPWLEPSSLGGTTWQEAYLSVLKCDRSRLLEDPDGIRFQEDLVYVGIHDFDGDGMPELIFGDGASLGVFSFSNGQVKKIADLYFPGNVWCVNGVHYKGNSLIAECNGSGGSDYVCFGYVDGEYRLGRYSQLRLDLEPTINSVPCTAEEINRIHTTHWQELEQEPRMEPMGLYHENGQFALEFQSGETMPVDEAMEFDRFAW